MTAPRVSIIMPARNAARWLHQAIESILLQTFPAFELIIVDDGSSDDTPAILASFQRVDERIRLLRQDQMGLVAALNRGLSAARGSLIARLDADDMAFARRLELQVARFEQRADLVLLGTWAEKIDAAGRPVGILRPESDAPKLKTLLASGNPFVHSSVMFDAAVARSCGGYRAALEAAEDFDLWLRLSERGAVENLREVLTKYRIHQDGVTTTKVVRQLFSTRLAVRSAEMRKSGRSDLAETWSHPPEWHSLLNEEGFSDAARVCLLLQHADRNGNDASIGLSEVRSALRVPLTHRERKIAQLALLNLVNRRDWLSPLSRAELMTRCFFLHPPRALKLLFERLTGHPS
jgi:glycosyltransferase involved in cell wall biosynthesis